MVMSMARAMAWGLSRLLPGRRDEPVAHGDLEHAHWDPARRRWFTHTDDRAGTVDRAA